MDLKEQLKTVINEACEGLNSPMSKDEKKRFLEPLESLLLDAEVLKKMRHNIGLFRTQDSFRILNIPVDVEHSCHLATSFHVKPLLRWLQSEQEFLLLGMDCDSAHLYLGSQTSLKLVDSILVPEFLQNSEAGNKILSSNKDPFTWLNDWLAEHTKYSKPKLFLAGAEDRVLRILPHLKYSQTVRTAVAQSFDRQNVSEICGFARGYLKNESQKLLENSLLEFRFAEERNRARKNIFQIARAVAQGKVRKLILTDDLSIFGKIDKKSGGLAIHPFDLDHEDDDILDDLAQMVLSQGGEVVLAKRDEIPKGRPILAILYDEGLLLEKTEGVPFEALEEGLP